jgi:hypothetical protein
MGETTAVSVINWITLILGSGVFVMLLRLTFVLGQYTQRVVNLEETLQEFKSSLHELNGKVDNMRMVRS